MPSGTLRSGEERIARLNGLEMPASAIMHQVHRSASLHAHSLSSSSFVVVVCRRRCRRRRRYRRWFAHLLIFPGVVSARTRTLITCISQVFRRRFAHVRLHICGGFVECTYYYYIFTSAQNENRWMRAHVALRCGCNAGTVARIHVHRDVQLPAASVRIN